MADRIEIAGNTLLGGASNQGNSTQSPITLLFSAIPMGDARFFYAEEEVTLSLSAETTDTSQKVLPANSLILGVSWYVTQALASDGTALTYLQFGDASTATRFGVQAAAANAIAAGVSGVGSTHMTTGIASATTGMFQAAAAALRCTIVGTTPSLSAGKVRIAVWGIKFAAPTA